MRSVVEMLVVSKTTWCKSRLVFCQGSRAGERESAGEGIVGRSRDAGRQCPGDKHVDPIAG